MTDRPETMIEQRASTLERQVVKMEEDLSALTLALMRWLDSPPEDRNFLWEWLNQIHEEFKNQSKEKQEYMVKTISSALAEQPTTYKAPADNAYDEATVFKRKAYDEAIASAIKAYEEAMASIRNAMPGKATDEARASVLKAYDEAVATALRVSDEAGASACQV